MKRCEKCNVDVRGSDSLCPLCQYRLTGEEEAPVFPVLPTLYIQHKLLFKLLILLTVSGGAICIAVNFMLPESGPWAIFVVFGVLCFWISLVSVLKRRDNLFKNTTFQVSVLSVLCILLDIVTGWNGWSLEYFLPIAYSVAMLSFAVIARVKHHPPEDYILYLFVVILFGIIPIILYFTGLAKVMLPSAVCMGMSVVSLVFLLVFEGKNMQMEINKRFHV